MSTCLLSAVVGEFGRIALEFLRRGTNPKIYEGAASKTLSLHSPYQTADWSTCISNEKKCLESASQEKSKTFTFI